MGIKSISLATALVLSGSVNAATMTFGNLTTDDTTDYFWDTTTDRLYLRFDTFNMTYAETVVATSAGGIFEDWSIATSTVADEFYAAAIGDNSTACDGPTDPHMYCGSVTGWADGSLGASYNQDSDYFWFLSTDDTIGRPETELGMAHINATGRITDYDDWGTSIDVDHYGGARYPTLPMNALLYIDPSPVPVPAAVWLFGSGLLGLVGVARRKKA